MISDEELYLQVSREFEKNDIKEALRAKAMTLVEDDEKRFKHQYVLLRVAELRKDKLISQSKSGVFIGLKLLIWAWIIWCGGAAILISLAFLQDSLQYGNSPRSQEYWVVFFALIGVGIGFILLSVINRLHSKP